MNKPIKIKRSPLITQVVKIAGLVIFAVFVGWPGLVNAQDSKGTWVFVDARLDEGNTYYMKNDNCLDTKIGMPSSQSMVHHIEGKGCWWAPKNEYSTFGFQWTDPGRLLIPESVVQMTLTATIEFDRLKPEADPGWGSITVLCGTGDKAGMGVPQEVGTLEIGRGKKGDLNRPTSAKKTIEWKVPGGSKDYRLQINIVGGAPQTKQTYIYWYEWRGETKPPTSTDRPGAEQQVFNNNNIAGVKNNPSAATTFRTDRPWLVTYVLTYHWNRGRGQAPGSIILRHQDGTSYGPWQASGRPNQGNQTNLYWECWPNVVIKPGVYTIIDSHPASWAWNAQSRGGIAEIRGVPR